MLLFIYLTKFWHGKFKMFKLKKTEESYQSRD